MQGTLKVTAEFLDGRPNLERELPCEYPAGAEQVACIKLLAQINATGGIMDIVADGVTLVPISTIKLLVIKAPSSIQAANLADLANLTMPTNSKH